MIKKISALVIALVLCLSVVVMPVNAAGVELGDAQIAFSFEWDKPYYNPGETAVLSIYMDAADDLSLFTGSFVFGLNSAVFTSADNTQDALREGSTTAEWFNAYYEAADIRTSILADTIVTKVKAANTAAENQEYDWYVKFTANKNGSGWHENTGVTNAGFGGADFNPNEPIITYKLKVSENAQSGSVAKAAITSGSINMATPVQTSWKYFKTATTKPAIAPEQIDNTYAVTPDEVLVTNDIVNPLKGQIRFHKNADGTFANAFDVRALAVISGDDFAAKFGSEEDAAKMIKEIGFVFAAGSNVTAPTVAAAKALVESENTEADGYKKVTVGYLSSSISDGNYAFSCIVEDIPVAQKKNSLGAVGYIKYEKDGTTYYSYYAASQSVSYETLYNAYVDLAFPA